jgi:hypothetical protein
MKPNGTNISESSQITKNDFDTILSEATKPRAPRTRTDRSNKIASRKKNGLSNILVQKINLNQTHKVTEQPPTLSRSRTLKFEQTEIIDEKAFHAPIIRLNKAPETDAQLYACCRGYIKGKTSTANFLKQLFCNKEHCTTCGQDYSLSHNRRIASALKYAQHINCMTYLVITTPLKLRHILVTKARLQEFRRHWVRKLKDLGYANGIVRYHWAGDDGQKWAPHLNILIEGKFMKPALLEQLKKDYKTWLWSKYKIKLSDVPVIHHCGYSQEPGKKAHWLAYVTRATWKNESDLFINNLIKGFRNNIKWGVWDFTGTEKDTIENSRDPATGEKIIWENPKKGGFVDALSGKKIIKRARKLPLGVFKYYFDFKRNYTAFFTSDGEIITPLKIPPQKIHKGLTFSFL